MGSGRKVFSGIVTGVLVFVFISFGLLKVTPKISEEYHKKLYHQFVRFSKAHPAVRFGYKIDPLKFMPQIGFVELVCAAFLVIGGRVTKLISCLLLSSVTVGALYFHYVLKDPKEYLIFTGSILLLLFLRLNLFVSQEAIKVMSETEKKEKKEK